MNETNDNLYISGGNTISYRAPPNIFEVKFEDGTSGCRLLPDGRFETFGGYNPDEAARLFWKAIEMHATAWATAKEE